MTTENDECMKELRKEITGLKKQVSQYETRLDDSLADSGIKERTIIHLNQYLDDVKVVNKQLELRLSQLIEENNRTAKDQSNGEVMANNESEGSGKEQRQSGNVTTEEGPSPSPRILNPFLVALFLW